MSHHKLFIYFLWKAPRKSLGVSVPGIGHSDIRGLVTYRSMVRREPCCLLAWITVPCADIVQPQMARTLKWPKPFQDVFRCFSGCRQMYVALAILHLLIACYSSGMAMSRACRRRRCFAPLTLTARCCTSLAHAMFPVIMPHMKQASSRATAVFATLAFLPCDNTIL